MIESHIAIEIVISTWCQNMTRTAYAKTLKFHKMVFIVIYVRIGYNKMDVQPNVQHRVP